MYINIVSSISAYIKAYTLSNSIIFKSNLAVSASNICKDIMAKVIALIDRSCCFCWFSQIINLALYFCRQPYLSVLYLNTHWHSSLW